MPRTFGHNPMHVPQVPGWARGDRALAEVAPAQPDANAVLEGLRGHRDLGVHTELLVDGIMDLVERGVVTGTHERLRRNELEATFCLGTRRLSDPDHRDQPERTAHAAGLHRA